MPRKTSQTDHASRDFLPVTAVLAAGLIATVFAFVAVRGYYTNADRQQFQRDAAYYGATFKSEVDRHVTSLAAIRAFVSASHNVSRWGFSAFARQILPQNSGFKAVLWLPHLAREDRKAFEAKLQNDGLYGLRLRELTAAGQLVNARNRPAYLPVAYVEPFEGNGSLIGVDLSNSPIYAPLFQAAQRTGRAAASAPIAHALVEGAQGPIALVVFPLNRTAGGRGPGSTPEGYALGVLQLNRVIEDVIGTHAPIQAVIGYGVQGSPQFFLPGQRVQASHRWFSEAAFHTVIPVTLADRQFLLALRAMPGPGNRMTRLYVPAGAALLVIALTALLVQSMLTTALGKRKVERAVVARTAQLREVNRILHEEVEQRRQTEAALTIAKDRAESASRAKSAFLATMSHELRTPLNAIIGFSDLLANGLPVPPERSHDYLHEINDNGIRLLDLIGDILEITQMDTEPVTAGEPVFLPDLSAAVMAKMQPLADKAGVALQCSVPDSLPLLLAESKRLQKALLHLVSNAVKFTPKGGWARMAAHAGADGVVIEVSDNGAGMPPEAQAQIAGLFSQFDAGLARRHEGTGLGLAFVRRVADHHDAALRISSKLGEGTQVSLAFPVHRVVKTAEVA
ncbi:MAG TPA: CHASE domain-containing protein [Rhizomicrobium sp.]|nr:CHASE domain-containing protein [Rhizomicrobium sp.]